jgi:type III pantothenate kinase
LWCGDTALHHWHIQSDARRTSDELGRLLDALVGVAARADDLDGSVMACVVPELTQVFVQVIGDLFGSQPLVVAPGVRTGLDVRTDDPREVGPDRVACAVSAKSTYGSPVIVVDFGTSTNVDVVDSAGAYVGTLIAPGLDVAAQTLAARTAGLPRVVLEPPPTAIADNTAEGLQSGLVLGYAGLVEGLVRSARAEVGPAPVVATGYAPWIAGVASACPSIESYNPLLTLDGLRRIHRLNT